MSERYIDGLIVVENETNPRAEGGRAEFGGDIVRGDGSNEHSFVNCNWSGGDCAPLHPRTLFFGPGKLGILCETRGAANKYSTT